MKNTLIQWTRRTVSKINILKAREARHVGPYVQRWPQPAATSRVSGSASRRPGSRDRGARGGEGVARCRRAVAASHKANWPDLDAKFLVCAANIHRGKVYDGQARHVLGSVFKDGLAHVAVPFLGLKGAVG